MKVESVNIFLGNMVKIWSVQQKQLGIKTFLYNLQESRFDIYIYALRFCPSEMQAGSKSAHDLANSSDCPLFPNFPDVPENSLILMVEPWNFQKPLILLNWSQIFIQLVEKKGIR